MISSIVFPSLVINVVGILNPILAAMHNVFNLLVF